MTEVEIRPMTTNDASEAAMIMAEAFGTKMPAFGNQSTETIANFMVDGGIFQRSQLCRHYVAVVKGGIAGVMHLETLKDRKQKKPPKWRVGHMCRTYGPLRVLLSVISLILLDNKLQDDEMIIDFVAVDPSYRGHGIGSSFLEFAMSEARGLEDISRLTLSVIETNKGAIRLYERMGFRVYKTIQGPIMGLLTGIKKAYKMEMTVD